MKINSCHILVAGAIALLAVTASYAQSKQSADRLAADNLFMTKAAQGGLAEVQMGQLATSRASNPQVKRFAQRMVDDHSKANNELEHLASQKGETLPTTIAAKDKDEIDKLSKLSGAEFDRTYLQYMVDDQKADIEEFKREAASGSDPPGKSVCRQNPADLRRAPEDGGADGSRTKKIAKWPRRTGAVCVFPLWNGCCQFSGHKPTIASKGKFMAEPKFETLFREQLESLYNAENQNAAALPKMIAAASSEELAGLLHSHLEETHQQVARLEHIFESMGEEPAVRESTGMKGLIQECENLISRLDKGALLDAAMIDSVQKVERYEICGYGTVQVLAEILGQQDTADLLEETIEEEKAADEGLWEIAESIFEGAGAVYSDTDIEAVILEEHRR